MTKGDRIEEEKMFVEEVRRASAAIFEQLRTRMM
ncbi:unnamed protein product, partial [marine sediment metagenome]